MPEAVKTFQKNKVKVNSVLKDGWNVVLLSIKANKIELFNDLVAREMRKRENKRLVQSLFQVTSSGNNIFHVCVKYSSLTSLMIVVDVMKSLDYSTVDQTKYSLTLYLNSPNNQKLTPFLLSVQEDNLSKSKYLSDLGCSISCKNEKLENALHLAFKNKSPQMIQFLSYIDSDSNKLRTQLDIKKRRPSDLDPSKSLLKFLRNPWELIPSGKLEALAKMLKSGKLDINQTTFKKKNTFLHLAVKHRQTGIIKFLITNGASPDLKNYKNLTPLQILAGEENRVYYSSVQGLFTNHSMPKVPSRLSLSHVRTAKRINLKEAPNRKSYTSLKIVLPALHSNINESMAKFLF